MRNLTQEFRVGVRSSIQRKKGSGRPRTSRTPDNIAVIRELVDNDPHLSKCALSHLTGIPQSTVQRILIKELNLHSVCARWIPHKLSDQQKENRVNEAIQILQEINDSIVVIDEKWLYREPMPARQNVRAWVGPQGNRPELPKRIISDEKYQIIVACNFRGEHYFEILPRGKGIDATLYCNFLQSLIRIRRMGNLKIMHDNARPHKATLTEVFLAEDGIDRLPHPAYSPDMNMLDRFLFRNIEAQRKDRVFADINDARMFVYDYLRNFNRRLLTNELAKFRIDLLTIVDKGGSYL